MIRLCDRRMFDDPSGDLVPQFLARVFALDDVTSIEINHCMCTAVIRFPRERPPEEMLLLLTEALKIESHSSEAIRMLVVAADQNRRSTNIYRFDESFVIIPAVFGVQRWAYLTLAGGSFAMSIVGVAVPGIPTVPFVLLTSYFLVRSSPTLNERLLQSRLFGPILRDWHKHGAVRSRVKWISIGVTLVILVVSVILAGISGPLLAIVLLMAAFGIYLILRLPTLNEPQSEGTTFAGVVPVGAA